MSEDESLRGILVAEPTGLVPVRGHRASVNITATAANMARTAFVTRSRMKSRSSG